VRQPSHDSAKKLVPPGGFPEHRWRTSTDLVHRLMWNGLFYCGSRRRCQKTAQPAHLVFLCGGSKMLAGAEIWGNADRK